MQKLNYISQNVSFIEQKNTKRREQKKGGGDGEPNLTPASTKTIYSNIQIRTQTSEYDNKVRLRI